MAKLKTDILMVSKLVQVTLEHITKMLKMYDLPSWEELDKDLQEELVEAIKMAASPLILVEQALIDMECGDDGTAGSDDDD